MTKHPRRVEQAAELTLVSEYLRELADAIQLRAMKLADARELAAYWVDVDNEKARDNE